MITKSSTDEEVQDASGKHPHVPHGVHVAHLLHDVEDRPERVAQTAGDQKPDAGRR